MNTYNEYSFFLGNTQFFFYIGKEIAWQYDKYKSEIHSHNYHEIPFIYKGEIEIKSENGTVLLSSGQAALIPAKFVHGIIGKSNHYRITVSFSFKKSKSKNCTFDTYTEFSNLISENRLIIIDNAQFAQAFERLLKYYYGNLDFKAELVRSCLCEIIILLKNSLAKNKSVDFFPQMQTNGYRTYIIEQFMHENYTSDISVKELAYVLNLSICQTQRIFKSVYSQTFRERLFEMRMILAKDLLENTDKSPTQIAYETGYSAAHGFFTAFKKYTGMTPTEYRKKS